MFHVKNPIKFAGVLFTLVGLLFVVIGGGLGVSNFSFFQDAIEAPAVIERIDVWGSMRNRHYTVHIVYENEHSELVNARLSSYDSSMYEGKDITVYYAEDTGEVRVKSSNILVVMFVLLGGVVAVVGISMLVRFGRTQKAFAELKANGRRVTAVITGYTLDYSISVNGRHPFLLICDDGKFESQATWLEPDTVMGQSVSVYLDREGSSSYYVDLSDLELR